MCGQKSNCLKPINQLVLQTSSSYVFQLKNDIHEKNVKSQNIFLFFTLDDFHSDINLKMMVDNPSFFNSLGFVLGVLKKEGLFYYKPPLKT